jgi:hypothetical protein
MTSIQEKLQGDMEVRISGALGIIKIGYELCPKVRKNLKLS